MAFKKLIIVFSITCMLPNCKKGSGDTSKDGDGGGNTTAASNGSSNNDSGGDDSSSHNNDSSTIPSNTSISIDSGAASTNTTSVTLTLAATNASQMYVTNTSGCASGGTWEAYATSKSWTLGQTNTTATVYVKFKSENGGESSCINDTITHSSYPNWYNGSWGYRIAITVQSSQIDSDLTDFPVYVDLSDFPSSFFTNVESDGKDIRVTKSDESTEVPFELEALNTGAETGSLWFSSAGTLSSSSNTVFYIYYGNSGASAYATDATYGSENVWDTNFVMVSHLHDDFLDSTSNDNDGTNTNSTNATGVFGDGQSFDGDDHILVSTTAAIPADITVQMWIKPSDTTTDTYVSDFGGTNEFAILCGYQDGHYNVFGGSYPTGDGADSQVAATGIGSWDHLVWTKNGTTVKGYRNGTEIISVTQIVGDFSPSIGLKIGRDWPSGNNGFNGTLDEYRVSSVARSEDWISAEYSNQSNTTGFYTVGSQQEY